MHEHSLTGWNPHTLMECVDSDVLGYLTAFLAMGMLIWYVIIARKWWESSRQASENARKAWHALILIFLVCAVAGYTSWIIAVAFPKFAIVLRIAALTAQNVVCPVFMYHASQRRFYSIGREQAVGEHILQVEERYKKMSDRELADVMRVALDESSERLGVRLA